MAPLLTVPEVAERLRMSRWSVYDLARDGRLRAVRLTRGKLLFTEEALAEAVQNAEQPERVAPGAAR